MTEYHGLFRISTVVPRVAVGDPRSNVDAALTALSALESSDIVVFPELSISGYSCGRLFHQRALLDAVQHELLRLVREMPNARQLVMVGLPLPVGPSLFNCVACLNGRRVIGIVPKTFIPTYNEFYEGRYFAAGHRGLADSVMLGNETVPFGVDLLFENHARGSRAVVQIEICESLWMPEPTSGPGTLAGANIVCNPSASPETIGKADVRRMLVLAQSARCLAAYAYAGCGPTESTAEVVFGGHALIAEGGHLVAESARVGTGGEADRQGHHLSADVDIERLQTERRTLTTFEKPLDNAPERAESSRWRRVDFALHEIEREPTLAIPAKPFVPSNPDTLSARCAEIFGIQTAALARRLELFDPVPKLTIGVSGGLDSTLALLVAVRTLDLLELPRERLLAITMPGFGTTSGTLDNARSMMTHLGVATAEIDIRAACLAEYRDLSTAVAYRPFDRIDLDDVDSLEAFEDALRSVPADERNDLMFENVQARRRTELLMNLGFVLGTGDMSELWLGWCTYNADQQSMYNVNCSVPKTLVRFLVEYVADHEFDNEIRETLHAVADTAISPELLPPDQDGNIAQETESSIGPYELHDFFMFHLARHAFSPRKVLFLAERATGFSRDYERDELRHWLGVNIRRAFSQQYKRDNVPNGPKIGTLSLSPRGDWRMPSDASAAAWLAELDAL